MKAVVKGKWLILIGWVLVIAALLFTAPNMVDLVREKGQFTIPEGSMSSNANKLLAEKNKDGDTQVVVVFHKDTQITADDEVELKRAVSNLDKVKDNLGITEILHYFDNQDLKKELVSKDGKTVLMSISFKDQSQSVNEVRKGLDEALKDIKIPHTYTGDWFISDDMVKSSQDGLKKTEGITVVFILVVLLLVFRSAIAPFIPLITVGISYIVTQSIVSFLVDILNFPLSTFTQIFLVVVLFGVGTDYCILLISRYKEELAVAENAEEAIRRTYRTAGKTVLFSGIAVMIGFAVIGFSKFKLYQSASAVAIGIAVLLLALFTIVPFFMATLKTKLFWPMKGSLEHKENKLWHWAGNFSLARPVITLLLLGVIIAPFLLFYDGRLSFNSLDEIGNKYDSVKAFNMISDSFGPGKALPTTIVLKNDEPMDNREYLAMIEKISREVGRVDGVDYVRSPTRPVGEEITNLYVTNQAKDLNEGLQKGNGGIQEIASGLQKASTSISDSRPKIDEAASGVTQLIQGTEKLKGGVVDLQDGLTRIEQGLRQGTLGAGELKNGVAQIKENALQLLLQSQKLQGSYQQIGESLSLLTDKYQGIHADLVTSSNSLQKIDQLLSEVQKRHPELAKDDQFQQAKKKVLQTKTNFTQIEGDVKTLNEQLVQTTSGVKRLNEGFSKINKGQVQLTTILGQIVSRLGMLEKGINQTANGQRQAIWMLPKFAGGLDQLQGGQQQLHPGISSLSGQLGDLSTGLDQSVNGLTSISGGLKGAKEYLTELSNASDEQMAGWFLPDSALKSPDFQRVFDSYMSPDRKIVTLDVIFKSNPYSLTTLDQVGKVKDAVQRAVKGTPLENTKMGIGGVSSTQEDLRKVSEEDYSRTVLFMLVGIGLVLLVLLRSVIMPLYLIFSLIVTYYMSMAVTEMIFVHLLGYSGINWVVPFFSFVILVALGVDYSIFLMSRFNEHRDLNPEVAIHKSMGKMGSVIISAAIILGGTFAAMIPSGVQSLLQIATIVLTGLLLYAFLFLPLFVPVMVKTFGKANWWPFKQV